jgi:hypothetical protein
MACEGCDQEMGPPLNNAGTVGMNTAVVEVPANEAAPAPPPPASGYASAIEAALREDRGAASHGASRERVDAMGAIDLSHAPADFKDAYREHIYAWRRHVRAHQAWDALNAEETNKAVPVGGIVCAVVGCEDNPIDSNTEARERVGHEIDASNGSLRSTFQDVQRVAARHGADHLTHGRASGM